MSIARIKNWNPGDILTAFDLNAEFNNILANPVSLWSPAQQNVSFNGKIVTWDNGAVSTSNSTTASGMLFSPGTKNGTPGTTTGSQLDIGTQVFGDSNTSASGTAVKYAGVAIHAPTLSAANTGVTTTDAATLYIDGPPVAGTNETITNPWAVWANGPARFGGVVQFDAATQGSFSPWSTGDVKLTMKTTADAGWVLMNDGTLGDASSGGTARANADTAALFALLWNNTASGVLTVSGGRGASAVSDYAAHKTITLPLALGRALVGAGTGSGLTARLLGNSSGAETGVAAHTHTATVTDPTHAHTGAETTAVPIFDAQVTGNFPAYSPGTTNAAATGISVANAITGTSDGNMQPSTFFTVMIKL